MEFMETLFYYKQKIEDEIAKFFNSKKQEATNFGGFTKEAYEVLKDYTLRGGKRFRSTAMIMAYRGVSGDKSDEKILIPAMSQEFMQSSLLVHDDIMDASFMRRGKPTAHIWIEDWYKKNVKEDPVKARWFGEAMAIILGDIYNSYGIQSLTLCDFPEEKKAKAIQVYNNIYETVGKGQILDVWFGERGNVTEQDYFDMIYRKTTVYTVRGPVHMGCIFGNANEEQLDKLTRFAVPVAQAFQIQDDILDMVSTVEKLGKPIGTDIREGKDTLLMIRTKKAADSEQMKVLNSILGRRDATDEEIQKVVQIVKDTGAMDSVKETAKGLAIEGKQILETLDDIDPETKKFFMGFADYMINRKY